MIKKWLKEYIEVNKRDIVFVLSFIIVGIIAGIGMYIFSSSSIKSLAISSVKEIFEISKKATYVKANVILNGIKADIILIGVMAILSVTLFGKWIIYGIMILKGVSISLYTILLFNVFGPLWGIIVFLLLVLMVNIIYIPALVYLTVGFLEINFNIFKAKIKDSNMAMFYKGVFSSVLSFILMFSSIILEQIFSSIVLNIYTKI